MGDEHIAAMAEKTTRILELEQELTQSEARVAALEVALRSVLGWIDVGELVGKKRRSWFYIWREEALKALGDPDGR